MLAKKNRANPTLHGAIVLFALVFFISGCTPAGPRALLRGKRDLDRGDNDAAVAQLKIATTLLATNAQAWNYYGVALQRAGQVDDAVNAYERALSLDRDLVEVHYNLGWLWLDQNKPDAARNEFTAYTLSRPNDVDGWLKLGSSQLRCSETSAAERSFSTAFYLNTNNAGALNGLGLARIQRDQPREAALYFAAAIRYHPDFAPAYLNLAAVSQEYLHDNAMALRNYRAYLALAPHTADWNNVNAIVANLERPVAAPSVPVVPAPANAVVESRPAPVASVRTYNPPKPAPVERTYSSPPPEHAVMSPPVPVEQVSPEPVVVATPPAQPASAPSTPSAEVAIEEPPPQKPSGFWHKLNPTHWFGSSAPEKKFDENGVIPLPSGTASANSTPLIQPPVPSVVTVPAPATSPESRPVKIFQPAPPVFPRYTYLSPPKPMSGNRTAAEREFARAREDEQSSLWPEAMESYGQAVRFDPGWFEAQYNFGVLSYRLRDYHQALAAYENALAIEPDSLDARYNFALTLKAAGYVTDAVNELKKVISANPDEVRAHLALGNIYAQQLHDIEMARTQYLRVLSLDPNNSQAPYIRYWLSSNPE